MSKEFGKDYGERLSPQKNLLDQYDQARKDLGPIDALDKVLRPTIKHTLFDSNPRKDLEQKVNLCKEVVGDEIRKEQERIGPEGTSDLLTTLEERKKYFDASLARYDADHTTPSEKRKHSTWGGNGFMDQVRASERNRFRK